MIIAQRIAIVSVLYREPKVLKPLVADRTQSLLAVSVLYREPKVLKPSQRLSLQSAYATFQCSTVSRKY